MKLNAGWLMAIALLAWGCGGSRDLAELPPYPEAFQRAWFDAQRDLAKGDAEAAYSELSSCALLEPEEPAIPFQMGKLDYEAERYSTALVHFNRAIDLGLEDPWARHYRALTLLALGDEKGAQKDVIGLVEARRGDIDYALDWVERCTGKGARNLAVAVCDAFEAAAASDPEISQERLSILSATATPERIRKELERMVSTFPDIVEFRVYYASFLEEQGDPYAAFDVLKAAEAIDPYNGRIQYALGMWYVDQHNDKLLVEHFTRAFASDDVTLSEQLNVLSHYQERLYSPVISAPLRPLLKAALEANGREAALYLLAAEVAVADDDLETARSYTRQAVDMQPHRVEAWRRLVSFDAVMGDWEGLERDAEAAVKRFPVDPELLLHAGMAAKALGHADVAVERCLEAQANLVFHNPDLKFRIHLNLGDALNAAGRPLEAAKTYDVLLEMAPNDATIWNNQAWYFAQAGAELDRALTAIQRAVEIEPGVAIFEDTYAWVLHMRGEHAGAMEWMERALKSDSNGGSAGMWENAGDIYRAAGDEAKAREAYERALERGAEAERIQRKMNGAS